MFEIKKSPVLDSVIFLQGVAQSSFFDNAVFLDDFIQPVNQFEIVEVFYCYGGKTIYISQSGLQVITHHPVITVNEKNKKLIEIAEAIIGITGEIYE